MTEAESRYTTTEQELLAIVYTIFKFRYYLIGVKFEIITDHKSLVFLDSTTYHNSRLIRWSLLLQQFSFEIKYCRGSENIIADILSRNPEARFSNEIENKIVISFIEQYCLPEKEHEVTSLVIMMIFNDEAPLKTIMKNLSYKQKNDPGLRLIVDSINNKGNCANYQIYRDVLFHRQNDSENWRMVIPECIKKDLITFTHERLGHPGVYKTINYIKMYYYWKSINRDVKKLILNCDLCQRVKHLTIAMEGEYQLVEAVGPNDLVAVDFYGPLPRGRGGVQYLFLVLDTFSKLVKLYTLKNATTHASLNKIIDKYIPECGKPKKILNDNGTQFTLLKWKQTLDWEGIHVIYSSIRHPQSNPSERVMREIGRMFRTFCEHKNTTWVEYVQRIENLLNITTHFSTEFTPYELHFGKPIPSEIKKIIQFPELRKIDHSVIVTLAKENINKHFKNRQKNQKTSKVELNIGDKVLLRVRHLSNALDHVTTKFFHLYEGPYLITKIVGKNAFVLIDSKNNNKIIGTYNRANLRKYKTEK